MKVDFCTFCHRGDAHRLHEPGQLKKQVESNCYPFNKVWVIHQLCNPADFQNPYFWDYRSVDIEVNVIKNMDNILKIFAIDLTGQYASQTDKAHYWKFHVVNHLAAISKSSADYIVFADNDCWMIRQPEDESWIEMGIWILDNNPTAFIVSPNDGEPERRTKRFSQQMFLARVDEFRNADFNQPRWDGNVNIPDGPMPEYWAMLEGRMELHCRVTGQYRYVLGPEYRYWHFNRLNENDMFETDLSKY
jgi:hypothetical protein